MRDDLTDVPGFRVGSAEDPVARTGCTVVLCPAEGAVAGVDQRGGAPGTRETDALSPGHLVSRCHAVLLTGGSAFGLDAAAGVVKRLEAAGVGFPTPHARVPIVPAAVLYDLGVGRSDVRPDAAMAERAFDEAERGQAMRQGRVGVGCGATAGKALGAQHAVDAGLGAASETLAPGLVIGALVVVNAFGDVVDPATGAIVAGTRRPDGSGFADTVAVLRAWGPTAGLASRSGSNTVLAVVATSARLDKEGAVVLARAAGTGLSRVLRPAHTLVDGDTVFALAAGDAVCDPLLLGAVAADLIVRAALRAVGRT